MADFTAFLANVAGSVEGYLDRVVPAADTPPERLHEAVRWSLLGGGKRVRPALVIATAETFGGKGHLAYGAAAALELIHTYSLIHDDLPSMDDDDLRRGRATCHKQFGEATAILAGDVLQTIAFQVLTNDELLPGGDKRLQIISLIAAAAADMVIGQQLDLDAEGAQVTLGQLEQIHRKKTGSIISASVIVGGLIGDATGDEITALTRYAEALGLLFQVTDDLLDITQSTETLGKTAGKDIVFSKATYPSLIGLEGTRQLAGELAATADSALSAIERDTSLLSGMVDRVSNRVS